MFSKNRDRVPEGNIAAVREQFLDGARLVLVAPPISCVGRPFTESFLGGNGSMPGGQTDVFGKMLAT